MSHTEHHPASNERGTPCEILSGREAVIMSDSGTINALSPARTPAIHLLFTLARSGWWESARTKDTPDVSRSVSTDSFQTGKEPRCLHGAATVKLPREPYVTANRDGQAYTAACLHRLRDAAARLSDSRASNSTSTPAGPTPRTARD